MAEAQELRRFIDAYPIIDSHAHNMIKAAMATDYENYPLEIITTENAELTSMSEAHKSIPYFLAVKQLAKFHGCSADLEAIKVARGKAIEDGYDALVRKCLQGTQMLLVDNGDSSEDSHYYEWYDSFTPGQSGSVAHLEILAETVIQTLVDEVADSDKPQPMASYWTRFKEGLQESVKFMLSDPDIKAFRSVANYRTGLNIERFPADEIITCFETHCSGLFIPDASNFLCSKPLNDYVIYAVLDILQEFQSGEGAKSIPLQFNTGTGAPDAQLTYSSPGHLQSLIAEYDKVDFVLLHASRAFLLEAAHLASVCSNVYLTFGEVFSMVSREGQVTIIRECLETTPANKILWASGGIYHPESYWLATQQFRHALSTILQVYIVQGDLTLSKAKGLAKDIMFNNANTLYSLDQQGKYTPCSSDKIPPSAPVAQTQGLFTIPIRPNKTATGPDDGSIDATRQFIDEYPSVKFIWVQWVDYKAVVCARMIPIAELTELFTGKRLTVPLIHKSLLHGRLAPSSSVFENEVCLYPDVKTLAINTSSGDGTTAPSNATAMAFLKTKEGRPYSDCPRAMVQRMVEKYKKEFDVSFLIGFELQVTILEEFQKEEEPGKKTTNFNIWLHDQSWSNVMSDTPAALPFVQEVLAEFSQAGVDIEQFYTGTSPGQFVFLLKPFAPLEAVDHLVKTRQVISRVAEKNRLVATLCPCPTPGGEAYNAAPVQISIDPPSFEDSFVRGVTKHFASILAFTLPQDMSYDRSMKESLGYDGRLQFEKNGLVAPMERIGHGESRFTAMDGLANPYLALAAILAGGYTEVEKYNNPPLSLGSLGVAPQEYSTFPRFFNPMAKLSVSLNESIKALENNPVIQDLLGEGFVKLYIAVQHNERLVTGEMSENDRRFWIMRRY